MQYQTGHLKMMYLLTADPDDAYTIFVTDLGAIDGIDEDNGPFVLHINPATYNIIAETKMLSSDYYGYGALLIPAMVHSVHVTDHTYCILIYLLEITEVRGSIDLT